MTAHTTNQQRILFGAAYYMEYEYEPKLEEDMRLLEQAHMNVIRVGESVWSRWEPREGEFHLNWLEPVLDAAYRHNIDVIIGLPTYAIPMWMARTYPDIALQSSSGMRRGFGAREEHNYNHPAFTYFAQRVCRKIVERYRSHPAVIGWQLHNEPGVSENDSPSAFEGFKNWLQQKYGTVENLNRAWGLVYWSHELTTWDDLWQPESNAQPQYDLDWRRYQAELTDQMLSWQHDLVDELRLPHQLITINYALGRYATDEATSARLLDVAGSDPYFQMQDGMLLPQAQAQPASWALYGAFAPQLYADRTYGLKQAPYFVMETNGGPIDGSHVNFPAYDGQWRQAAWQFVSRGSQMVEYWQWRQIKFGTEEYWGGIIPHDDKPGRVYRQLQQLGSEFERAGSRVTDLTPDSDVAMLYSIASRWALSYTPHIAGKGGSNRNEDAFDATFNAFYQGAFDSGHQVRVVYDTQLVAENVAGDGNTTNSNTTNSTVSSQVLWDAREFAQEFSTLVVAGVYVCSDALLQWLRDYVNAGGHLILGPRSTYADSLAGMRSDIKPSRLADLAGAYYQEFSNVINPVVIRQVSSESIASTHSSVDSTLPALPDDAKAQQWIDCLIANDAQVLARCEHPQFKQFSLVTTHEVGQGRVTVVGTIPNRALAAWVYDVSVALNQQNNGENEGTHVDESYAGESRAAKSDSQNSSVQHEAQWRDAVRSLPTVRHTSAVNTQGERLHFLYNFAWEPCHVQLPYACTTLLDNSSVESLNLGAWDVQIVVE